MRAQQIPVPEQAEQPLSEPAASSPAPLHGELRPIVLTDGRTLHLSKPRGAYSLKIFEWLGPQNSTNEMLIIHYRALLHVARIDGQDEPTPQTKLQLEALAQKLGDDALDEIAAAYLELFVGGAKDLRPL